MRSLLLSIQIAVFTILNAEFCVFPDAGGSGNILDLFPLRNVTISGSDQEYNYIYTPCRNGEKCSVDGQIDTAMATQERTESNECYVLANWDNGDLEPTFDMTDQTWKFEYMNGNDCNGAPRHFYVYWNCDMDAGKYVVSSAGEIMSCVYEIYINSELACPGFNVTTTTSTTAVPHQSCVWKSSDGQHTLNISSVTGNSLSAPDSENSKLFYVYTPCSNTLKCDNNTLAMAYLIDTSNFHCDRYLAQWVNGMTEPNYNEDKKSWQFVYQNGEKCDGFESTFFVYWNCDTARSEPLVTFAGEIGSCTYQMVINSTLACD